MTQMDLIPAKTFSQIASDNFRRLAIAPVGSKRKVEKQNIQIVKACLKAEQFGDKVPVKHYVRSKSKAVDASLPLGGV